MSRIIILAAIMMFSNIGFAQQQSKKEKMEAMKVAFITNKLNLTSGEAQKFWPVYNEYQAELEAVKKAKKMNVKKLEGGMQSMSDTQVSTVLETDIGYQGKEMDLKRKYHQRFKEVLPIKKLAMLYKAERDFKRMLLERLREYRDPSRRAGGQ